MESKNRAFAERLIAAGAPEANYTLIRKGMISVLTDDKRHLHLNSGSIFSYKGLYYQNLSSGNDPKVLPLLSHYSWLGLVLGLINQRGRQWSIVQNGPTIEWEVRRFGAKEAGGVVTTQEELLVSMLEAVPEY